MAEYIAWRFAVTLAGQDADAPGALLTDADMTADYIAADRRLEQARRALVRLDPWDPLDWVEKTLGDSFRRRYEPCDYYETFGPPKGQSDV